MTSHDGLNGLPPAARDRRGHVRYVIPVRVNIRILIPEDTFSTLEYTGVAADISEGGCRIRINQFPKEQYQRVMPQVRYMKLGLELQPGRAPVEVRARTVWLEFHDGSRNGELPHCLIGVAFTQVSPEFTRLFAELVARHRPPVQSEA